MKCLSQMKCWITIKSNVKDTGSKLIDCQGIQCEDFKNLIRRNLNNNLMMRQAGYSNANAKDTESKHLIILPMSRTDKCKCNKS